MSCTKIPDDISHGKHTATHQLRVLLSWVSWLVEGFFSKSATADSVVAVPTDAQEREVLASLTPYVVAVSVAALASSFVLCTSLL